MFRRLSLFIARTIIFGLCVSTAHAQTTGLSGLNLDFYRPSVDGLGGFSTEGHGALPGGELYFGLSHSLLIGPLFEVAINGAPTRIVNHVYTMDAVAAIALTDFLTVGVDAPFHLYAREADFNTGSEFTHRSAGDLGLSIKGRLLRETASLPGISLIVRQALPTGQEDNFLGNRKLTPGASIIIGKNFKYLSFAVNAGADFLPQTTVQGVAFNDRLVFGTHIGVPVRFLDPSLSFIGEFEGQVEMQEPSQRTSPMGFMAGIRKDFESGIHVLAGGGGGWNDAFGNPVARAFLNVGYAFPVKRKKIEPPASCRVYFNSGDAKPKKSDQIRLQKAAHAFVSRAREVCIEGHTDSVGSANSNRRLSQKRVESVRQTLLQTGMPPHLIQTRTFGESKPIAPNNTSEDRQKNRRVEIIEIIKRN